MEHNFRLSENLQKKLDEILPKVSDAEVKILEEKLISEGCRNPLVIWDEENTLVDGHHRLAICEVHGIEYKTIRQSFKDEREALFWAYKNNKARRGHGTTYSEIEGALFFEPEFQAEAEDRMKAGVKVDPPLNCAEGKGDTRDFIAELANCSHSTVDRVKEIQKNGERIFGISVYEEILSKLRSSDSGVSIYGIYTKMQTLERVKEKLKNSKASKDVVEGIAEPKQKEEFIDAVDEIGDVPEETQQEVAEELDDNDDKYSIKGSINTKTGKKEKSIKTEKGEIPFDKYFYDTCDVLGDASIRLIYIKDFIDNYEKEFGEKYPVSDIDNKNFYLSMKSLESALKVFFNKENTNEEKEKIKLIS